MLRYRFEKMNVCFPSLSLLSTIVGFTRYFLLVGLKFVLGNRGYFRFLHRYFFLFFSSLYDGNLCVIRNQFNNNSAFRKHNNGIQTYIKLILQYVNVSNSFLLGYDFEQL